MELSSATPEQSQFWPSSSELLNVTLKRIIAIVAMHLKNSNSTFDGDLGESWRENLTLYIQIAKNHNTALNQKLCYHYNELSKGA